MQEPILRKLFLAFMHVHILHHASKERIYGAEMMQELQRHGYEISPGTMYPILNGMERAGLLESIKENVNGKQRKYYTATQKGNEVLLQANEKVAELVGEL